MKLVTATKGVKHHTSLWLTLWQGGVGYTAREKEVLLEFIISYLNLKSQGLIEPFLSKEVFSTEVRKEVCERLSISTFNLTNVLAALKTKGCISEEGRINTQLIPEKELIFEFK